MLGWVAGNPASDSGEYQVKQAFNGPSLPDMREKTDHSRHRGRRLKGAVFSVVLVVLLGACAESEGGITLVADVTASGSEEPLGYALAGDDVTGIGPTLTVKVGEPVTLTLENHDELEPHNFAIVPKVDDIRRAAALGTLEDEVLWESSIEDVGSGENMTVTFTPDAPGSYYYVCTITGHAAAGMMGELIVVEGE
jgi:plastocyanin